MFKYIIIKDKKIIDYSLTNLFNHLINKKKLEPYLKIDEI